MFFPYPQILQLRQWHNGLYLLNSVATQVKNSQVRLGAINTSTNAKPSGIHICEKVLQQEAGTGSERASSSKTVSQNAAGSHRGYIIKQKELLPADGSRGEETVDCCVTDRVRELWGILRRTQGSMPQDD